MVRYSSKRAVSYGVLSAAIIIAGLFVFFQASRLLPEGNAKRPTVRHGNSLDLQKLNLSKEYTPAEIEAFYGLPENIRPEDVLTLPPSGRTLAEETYEFRSVWLRLRLPAVNKETEKVISVLPPLFDRVELHQYVTGGVHAQSSFFRLGFAGEDGSLENPMPSFGMLMPKGETVLIIRLEAINALQASVYVENPHKAFDSISKQHILMGAFFGILFALMFYNWVVYRVLRHRFLLHYLGVMTTSGLFAAALHGYMDFWIPGGLNFGHRIGFLNYLILASLTFFLRSFLMTPRLAPWLDYYHQFIIAICLTGAAISLTPLDAIISPWAGPGLDIISGVQALMILATGVVVLWRGFTPARFFLLAWTISLLGVAITFAGILGVLPMTFWVRFGMQISGALEMVVFAVAVGDRFRRIQQEKIDLARASWQNQRLKTLIDMACHDISSPLSVIQLHADIAQAEGKDNEQWESIRKAATQQSNILRYIRSEQLRSAGTTEDPTLERAELSKVIPELQFLFGSRAARKGVLLRLPQASSLKGITLRASSVILVNSILGNLFSNAIKFTTRGGAVSFEVTRPQPGWIAMSIIDEGIGLEASELALIESGDIGLIRSRPGTEAEEGSGLGLGIVRSLTESLGGTLKVENRPAPEKGTKVTIRMQEAEPLIESRLDIERNSSIGSG